MTNPGTEAYLLVVCVCEGTINKEPEKYSMLHVINVLEKEKTRREAVGTALVNSLATC